MNNAPRRLAGGFSVESHLRIAHFNELSGCCCSSCFAFVFRFGRNQPQFAQVVAESLKRQRALRRNVLDCRASNHRVVFRAAQTKRRPRGLLISADPIAMRLAALAIGDERQWLRPSSSSPFSTSWPSSSPFLRRVRVHGLEILVFLAHQHGRHARRADRRSWCRCERQPQTADERRGSNSEVLLSLIEPLLALSVSRRPNEVDGSRSHPATC